MALVTMVVNFIYKSPRMRTEKGGGVRWGRITRRNIIFLEFNGTCIFLFFSFVPVSVNRQLVNYWVVLFHPRTAAIRLLDSGFMYYFTILYFPKNPTAWPIIPRGQHSRRSIPLHLIRSPHWMCFSPPPSPPVLPLPLPPRPTPMPTLNPYPLPVPSPFPNQCLSGPTTAWTPSPPSLCGPFTQVQNRSRRNVLRDRVLPICD